MVPWTLALGVLAACSGKEDSATPLAENNAPHADIDADDAKAGLPVDLDASRSWDPDGDPITFAWSFDHVPEGSAMNETAVVNNGSRSTLATFTPDRLGTYVVKLVPTDGRDLVGEPAYASVVVTEDGAPAVADAGDDVSALVGDEIHLDGSRSHDDLGRAISYGWTLALRPPGSKATLNGGDGASPSFIADVAGLYSVSLEVSNGATSSNPDAVDVYVSNPTNTSPVSVISSDGIVVEDCTDVPLDGSTSYDPEGDPLEYHWSLQARPKASHITAADISDNDRPIASFPPDVAGTYQVSLAVFDGSSWTVEAAQIDAIERTYNTPPVVETGDLDTIDGGTVDCVQKGPTWECGECADVSVTFGDAVTLTDADGDDLSVVWLALSPDASITSSPNELVTSATLEIPQPREPGCINWPYKFELAATDCPGATSTDTLFVTVQCCAEEK